LLTPSISTLRYLGRRLRIKPFFVLCHFLGDCLTEINIQLIGHPDGVNQNVCQPLADVFNNLLVSLHLF
jgi:hypothetical protein